MSREFEAANMVNGYMKVFKSITYEQAKQRAISYCSHKENYYRSFERKKYFADIKQVLLTKNK